MLGAGELIGQLPLKSAAVAGIGFVSIERLMPSKILSINVKNTTKHLMQIPLRVRLNCGPGFQ